MVEVASVKDIHERARLGTLQAVAGLTAPSIISLACSLADAGLSLERDGDLSEALCVYYQADNLIKHVLGTVEDKRKPIESQQELLYRQTKNLGEHVTSQILHRARKIEEQLKETEHCRTKQESDVRPTGSVTNHLKIFAETSVRAQTPAGPAKPFPPRPDLFRGPSPALLHTTSMGAGVPSVQHELNLLNNLADSRPSGKMLPSAPALLPGASPSGLTTSTSISGVAETFCTLPSAPQPHNQSSLNTPAKTAKLPAPLRGLRGMFRRMVTPKPATNDLGTSPAPSPNSVVSTNHGGAQLSSTRSRRLPFPPKPAHASTSMALPHSIAGHQVVQSSTLGISISPKEANEHQPEPRENPTTDPFEDADPLEVSDWQPRSLRAKVPIDMSRLSRPTAAPSLIGSEFGQAFARQNRVSPAPSAFPTAPPNLEGPRLGSISTNGQLGVTFASATKVLPSLPEPPKTDGRSQFGLPPITNPVTALSLKAYLGTASQVLLLDVRPREDFEARRLPVDNAVCIEPTLLTCGRVSAMGLQGALRLSSMKEYALFERRDTFDLVVLCDEDSTTLTDPGRSLGVLLSIVYETTLLKPLRQPPAFLYGGVRAWGSDVGEFIRPQTKGNVVSRFTDATEQLARQPTASSQPASGSISYAMIPQGTGLPGVSFFHQPSVHPKPPASWASLSGTHVHPHTHPTYQTPNSSLTHTRINPFVQYQPVNQLPCSICLEVPKIFPDKLPTARCKHAPQVCAGCLQEHIGFSVQKEGKTVITCPDPGCREELDYADVLRGANNHKEYIGRYETLLLRRVLEKDPNFVWCKNPSCNWGQVHESGANAPIVICQVCESRSCFTHDAPWHTGFTCKEYDAHMKRRVQIAKEEQASEQCIKQNSKKCPNISCGRPIQKNQGCDHMTCDKRVGCGHEFCWICLASYEPIRREGNHRHHSTCQHYRPPGGEV